MLRKLGSDGGAPTELLFFGVVWDGWKVYGIWDDFMNECVEFCFLAWDSD